MGVKTNKTVDSFTLLFKNSNRVFLLHCRQRTVCPLLQSGLVLANSLDPYLHTRSPYRLVKALLNKVGITVLSSKTNIA